MDAELSQSTLSEEKWKDFKERFRKRYPSEREDNFRKQLFLKKLRHVEEHNEKYDRGLAPFKIGLHQFSDYTDDEKKTILLDWK